MTSLLPPGAVRLLDEDPALASALPSVARAEATKTLLVGVRDLARGRYAADGSPNSWPAFGLLMLDGLLLQEVVVGGRTAAEVLSPGDLLHPGAGDGGDTLLPRSRRWTVLEPTRLAVLDARFTTRATAWPPVLAALVDRLAQRVERLSVQQAIAQLTRVDERLLRALWHLAERHGKVTSEGVVLPLRVPHRVLASLVGAHRPSVTSALGDLAQRGLVTKHEPAGWLLTGEPPSAPAAPVPSMLRVAS